MIVSVVFVKVNDHMVCYCMYVTVAIIDMHVMVAIVVIADCVAIFVFMVCMYGLYACILCMSMCMCVSMCVMYACV